MLAAGLNCLEFCNPQALKLENAILGDNEFLSVLHDLVLYTLCKTLYADVSKDTSKNNADTIDKIKKILGEPRNYGPTPEELEEMKRAEVIRIINLFSLDNDLNIIGLWRPQLC